MTEASSMEKGNIDDQIRSIKRALGRSRAVRVGKGKATGWDMFWFGKGFGRGRYALVRLTLLLLVLGILYLGKFIKGVFTKDA